MSWFRLPARRKGAARRSIDPQLIFKAVIGFLLSLGNEFVLLYLQNDIPGVLLKQHRRIDAAWALNMLYRRPAKPLCHVESTVLWIARIGKKMSGLVLTDCHRFVWLEPHWYAVIAVAYREAIAVRHPHKYMRWRGWIMFLLCEQFIKH